MPVISTDIHLKESQNVRFYPRQRYGPWPHRRESALRDLDNVVFGTSSVTQGRWQTGRFRHRVYESNGNSGHLAR